MQAYQTVKAQRVRRNTQKQEQWVKQAKIKRWVAALECCWAPAAARPKYQTPFSFVSPATGSVCHYKCAVAGTGGKGDVRVHTWPWWMADGRIRETGLDLGEEKHLMRPKATWTPVCPIKTTEMYRLTPNTCLAHAQNPLILLGTKQLFWPAAFELRMNIYQVLRW